MHSRWTHPHLLQKKKKSKFKNPQRLVGQESKWRLGNLCHLNSPTGLPIVLGQILVSLGLIGISPSEIFIEFSILLTHLNSVGTNIWKGALISWRWWNVVILRQRVCRKGFRTKRQGSQVLVRGCLLSFPLCFLCYHLVCMWWSECLLF